MRTLTISKCLPYISGPSILAFEESRILTEMGHTVEFLTYAPDSYPSGVIPNFDQSILARSGINFHYVKNPSTDKLVTSMMETALVSLAIEIIQKKTVDVIYAHYTIPHGLIAVALAHFFRIPSVVVGHGSDIRNLAKTQAFRAVSLLIFNRSDLLITVSENLRQDVLSCLGPNSRREIVVLPTAVDVEKFTPAVPAAPSLAQIPGPKIIYVGRFNQSEKRLDLLLLALQKLKRLFPKIKLVLVGVNSGDFQIESELQSLNQTGSVILIKGAFETLPDIYQSCDVAVLCSEQEGLPAFLCEASASGLPIVTTPVGSVPQYFQEGKHCFYAQFGDPDELAEKIGALLVNPELHYQMRQANRILAQGQFDLRKRCEKLLELIEKLH